MSSDKPPDPPKPPVIVECHYFQNNERWFGYKFQASSGTKTHDLQAYGPTGKEAEDRLHEMLRCYYGEYGYSIKVVNHVKPINPIASHACEDAPIK